MLLIYESDNLSPARFVPEPFSASNTSRQFTSSSLAKVKTYGIIEEEKTTTRKGEKMKRFDEQERKKSILKSITPGERLKLRDDALGHVQPRQWIFKRIESNDTVLLMDESGGFGWSVKIDNIDWEACEKQSGKSLSQQN